MRIPAEIVAIRQETPTIKSLALDLGGRRLGFAAGQWVDFFVTIEGAEAVGGYSITSSPAQQTRIGLAVRRDSGGHAATAWIHEEAKPGDAVEIALGGDFFYTPDECESAVLIGGGIGLTPLMSIARAADELASRTRLTLVYSASTPEELLFREELEAIAARNPRIECAFTVTRPPPFGWIGHVGRIDARLLRAARVDMDALFFICGPPAMIDDMAAMLYALGAPPSRVRFERWW